ncbi:penicillin-binding protein 2 [Flavobacterium sp. NRK F10]|uniref:penicillin-binding protein 2 n=1 Tax=Flavobacterium sp. NRK F10 TaxID=2954931 RepID=UPI002090A057|nr:penicillin-binding protein 2 [Flavobacterium sp. NRK F10]MCO6174559.1 penicillin-binding protein 2 [Flavobacterium sp. NRK F10]
MRKFLLPGLIVAATILLLAKIFYLQVIDDSFKLQSENNAIKKEFDFPERGYIYDRNGKLLVANQPSYDIMVVPREMKNIDTLELCKLLSITKEDFIKKITKAKKYSPRLPSVFIPQLNKREYAGFQEKERKFEGFYTQKRALRDYQVSYGANIFGFIAQVNETTTRTNPYYNSGDLIGKQGLEKEYEEVLRGVKGVKYLLRDKHNKIIDSYKEGKFDTIAQQGKDLTLTIDADLQEYGTKLMVNKRGGIVAIEPSSGEILALISAPTYDPGLLVGRQRSKNYTNLYYDSIAKPLYDRALLASYPPGSPFKILTGLIGLQEQVIDEHTTFYCNHGANFGRFMGCHCGYHALQLNNGIYRSCNSYFGNTYKRIIEKYPNSFESVDTWANHVKSFGLGQYLGTDMPIGAKGLVPDSKLYKRVYKGAPIRSSYIISNAIGQGEILTTPIQLANMMAAVANRGYFYTPHIVRKIKGQEIDKKFTTKHVTSIDKEYFEPVIQGLADVYNPGGTAAALHVDSLQICGKTGTAENKIRVGKVTYKLQDHSIFVAFAPKDNPKIAIAVFIENGYWGSRWAGPIATLMVEKYVKGKITRKDLEDRMLNGSIQDEYQKLEDIIYGRNTVGTKKDEPIADATDNNNREAKEEENH